MSVILFILALLVTLPFCTFSQEDCVSRAGSATYDLFQVDVAIQCDRERVIIGLTKNEFQGSWFGVNFASNKTVPGMIGRSLVFTTGKVANDPLELAVYEYELAARLPSGVARRATWNELRRREQDGALSIVVSQDLDSASFIAEDDDLVITWAFGLDVEDPYTLRFHDRNHAPKGLRVPLILESVDETTDPTQEPTVEPTLQPTSSSESDSPTSIQPQEPSSSPTSSPGLIDTPTRAPTETDNFDDAGIIIGSVIGAMFALLLCCLVAYVLRDQCGSKDTKSNSYDAIDNDEVEMGTH